MQKALDCLRKGKRILIYSPKEKETAMMVAAEKVNLNIFKILKKYAADDISVAISYDISEKLGLPPSADVSKIVKEKFPPMKKAVVEGSSISLSLDHAFSKTGSSDKEKLLLIKELVKVVKNGQYDKFLSMVRFPGHVRFLIASKKLLDERRGHTELAIALTRLAHMHEIVVVSDMRDERTGQMFSKKDAERYAQENDLCLLDENEIVKSYRLVYGTPTG